MPFDRTKIRYVYSGSGSSTNPQLSLGGPPSLNYVTGTNLFSNISAAQSTTGKIDYRCVYLVNENSTNSLFNVSVLLSYDYPNTVSIDFGCLFQNERQIISLSNYTVGTTTGKFTLRYTDAQNDHSFDVNADTIGAMANTIKTELETVLGAANVNVTGTQLGTVVTYQIDFVNGAGYRYHDIITSTANTLSPASTIAITKNVNGAPLNSVADPIDVDTTPPVNITFTNTIKPPTPFSELKGLDHLPIWIRRTVAPNSTFVENDSFILRSQGTTGA